MPALRQSSQLRLGDMQAEAGEQRREGYPEPAVLQRLKWSAGGSPRTNGSPRAHTPASPAETRQRCDICNCNVPNGAHGMKLHQEGKRHKGMVQLMRL